MANDIKVLKNNTLEELRQKTNEVSFNQGDSTTLDTTRLADKVFSYSATTANGGKFFGSNLVFSYLPEVTLDNTGGYIVLKDNTAIPASFATDSTLSQSGGFSATLVSISIVDGKKKLLVKNTSGNFNAGEDLTDGTGSIGNASVVRIIAESYQVGSIRVTKAGTELVQDLTATGYHVPTIAGSIPLTGTNTLTDITEGTLSYQGTTQTTIAGVEANGSWYGTVYHINATTLLVKTVSGVFAAGNLIRFLGLDNTIAGANHGNITNLSPADSHIVELNTPATNGQAVKVITGDIVDAVNELQDDIGTVENLQSRYSTKEVVTALNQIDTHLYDSGVSFTGLSANDFKAGINELRAELGNHNDINNATGYTATTAVTGITEIQGDIGDVTGLNTVHQSTLVGAINEIEGVFDASTHEISAGSNTFTINSDNFTVNSAGTIKLDTEDGIINLFDNTTQYGALTNSGGNLVIKSGTTTILTGSGANATFNNNLTVENNLDVDGNLNVDGTGVIDLTLSVGGLASLNGGIAVDSTAFTVANTTGNTSIAGTLGVTGATTLTGNLATQGSNTLGNGAGDDTTVSGDLTVNVNTLLSGTVNIDGATDIDSTLDVLNGTTLRSTLDVTGITNFNNTTQSGSTTTGAVRIDGGLGIAKNTYVGGNLDVTGTLDIGTLTTTAQTVKLAIDELQSEIGSAVFTGDITNGAGSVTAAIGLIETEIGDDEAYRSPAITYGATTVSGVLVNLNDELDALNGLTLTAGSGLTGGGTLASNRTFNVGQGTGISVTANAVGIATGGVGTTQLATNAVTTIKITDGDVTNAKLDNSTITIGAETGTAHAISLGETLTVSAGEGINTNITNNTLQISGEDASDTNKGVAKFTLSDFTVSSGNVSLKDEAIQDIVGGMVDSSSEDGILVTYDDASGKLHFDMDDAGADGVMRLSGNQSIAGTKTFTGTIDLTGGSLLLGGGEGSTQTFDTAFITLASSSSVEGLSIDRGEITSASVETTADAKLQWNESQVDTGANNTSHRAWQLVGLTNANAPATNTADIVTFYNAKDLVASNTETAITVGWDATNQNFDFGVNVDNSSIEVGSNNLRVKALGITNAMLAGSIAASKLAGSIPNSKLSNSSITIGNSTIALGGSDTTLTGLTDIDLTSGNKTIFDGVGANNLTIGASTTSVIIAGNLEVQGTTTYLNTTNVEITDKNILLGKGSTTSTANTGTGITFGEYAEAATFNYNHTGTKLESNKNIQAPTFLGNLAASYLTGTIADARLPNSISSSITGNAATATQVYVTENNTENTNLRLLFHDGTGTGNSGVEHDDNLLYNPSSNTLTAGTFSGAIAWTNITGKPTLDNYNYWTLQADSGSNDSISSTEVVDFQGGNAITTTANSTGVSIALDNNSIAVAELNCSDGDAGNVLQTDGNGNLSFGAVSTVNNYLTGLSFNTGNGILTATRQGLGNITESLDGRYLTTDQSQATVFQVENDASADQFSVGHGDGIEFAAGGNLSVSFNASQKKVTYSYTTPADDNTTYLLKAQQTDGNDTNPNLFLDASTGSDDFIKLVGSGETTVTRNNDGQITFNTPSPGNGTLTLTTSAGLDGSATFTANQAGASTYNVSLDLSELTDMTAAVVGTQDELILLDSGAERRKLISEITLSDFNNDLGWTSNIGDITGVNITAGKGLVGSVNTGSGQHTQTLKVNLISDTAQTVAANSPTTTAGKTYPVQFDADDDLVVNVPWVNTQYGRATATTLGLVELRYNEEQTVAAEAASSTASRTYGLQEDGNGRLVVNVPWQNTVTPDTTDWDVANSSNSTRFTVTKGEKVRFIASGASTVSFNTTDQSITYSSVNTWQENLVNQDGYVPAPGSSAVNKVWKTNGSGVPAWRTDEQGLTSLNLGTTHNASTVEVTNTGGNNATINAVTTSTAGVMTKDDKIKLNGIDTSADVNQNSYLTINAYRTPTSNLISTGNAYGSSTTWVPSSATSVDDSISFFSGPGIDIRGGHISSTATNEIQWDLDSDQRSVIKKIGVIGTGNMSIDASGTGYIYFDSHSGSSDTTGTHEIRFSASGQIDADGDIIAYSSATSSDRKLKENIQKVEGALELVSQLDGVTFDWKDKERGSSAGVIAQNVEEVLPSAVKDVDTLSKEGETHKVVDYNQLSALFIEAIKELKEENKSLRDEIQKLINKE
jgi:fibronectin-binding autotransporter adhesin